LLVPLILLRVRNGFSRSRLNILDLLILLLIIGHAIFATWAPMYEWDWFGIWGLKARTFFDAGSIDWRFVQSTISHPDYPLLAPLLVDLPSVLRGAWEDRFVGLMYTAVCAGFILVARGLLAEELQSDWMGALATLAITCPALNLWIGLGEGMVMAYGCAGLLLVRRGLVHSSNASLHLGAVLLGLSAWGKNEGLALTAMAIIAAAIASWRSVWRLWPSVATAGIWITTRAVFHLPTDFMQGDVFGRVWFRLHHSSDFLRMLWIYAPDLRLFWLAALLTIVLFAKQAWRRERFLLVALFLQAALMAGQALATRADLESHIEYAWNRLPHQIAPAFGVLAAMLLLPEIVQRSPLSTRSAT
jgi:hypothetical protein